jgi:two-component system chemotaxis sensor kinase CheA
MKINARIIFITFLVIVIVSASSSLVYFSLTNSILDNRNQQNTLNSVNDFVFFLESVIESANFEYNNFLTSDSINETNYLDSTKIHFILAVNEQKEFEPLYFNYSTEIKITSNSLDNFLEENPQILLLNNEGDPADNNLFGVLLTDDLLEIAAKKIRAEVAVIINNIPYSYSNKHQTDQYLLQIVNAEQKLRILNNFDIISTNNQFYAAKYTPNSLLPSSKLSFIIFNIDSDLIEFVDTMKYIIPVIVITGILMSLIFVLLFTSKFRRQISYLTEAASRINDGNLNTTVPIITNDEVGDLSNIFNEMTSHIKAKEELEKEYSNFVSLINRNIDLNDLAEDVLQKLLEFIGFKFGAIYHVEGKSLRTLKSIGIDRDPNIYEKQNSLLKNVIDSKKFYEMKFTENHPIIRSASLEVKVKYLLLLPVVFGEEVIAIIELVSEKDPIGSRKDFLPPFVEQFAVGLKNAISYEALSNLVVELQKLNEEYHVQNEKVKGQNEELIKLHKEISKKADELENQRQRAVELSMVKSQFLASMSHELKTPLNSIIGLTELVEKDYETLPKTRDRVKIVLRNGKKLLGMINNILEFSKIESGKYETNEQTFLISEFLSDIFASTDILANEKKLLLTVKIEGSKNFLVRTDKDKLEHITLNLISNAIKFSEKGSVSVVVYNKDNDLFIKVIDTGIGISQENQDKIFSEFQQIESGNSKKYSGAGLGLAICKRFVNLLGGRLTLESNENVGSVFEVLIPECISEELDYVTSNIFHLSNELSNIKPPLSNNIISANTKKNEYYKDDNKPNGPCILIVDDDNDALYTVAEILNGFGYDLNFATNGVECLNQIEILKPDLVLLDIMMPEMDGFETIRQIRSREDIHTTKVFALTAHAMLDDKHIIEQSGFDDLLTKPVDSTNIQFKVKQALASNQRNLL